MWGRWAYIWHRIITSKVHWNFLCDFVSENSIKDSTLSISMHLSRPVWRRMLFNFQVLHAFRPLLRHTLFVLTAKNRVTKKDTGIIQLLANHSRGRNSFTIPALHALFYRTWVDHAELIRCCFTQPLSRRIVRLP